MPFFNPNQFAELLRKAKGNRSITAFGIECKVDPGYLSRLLRTKLGRPPSPEVIYRIADKAYIVTYEDLMVAAGYLDVSQHQVAVEPRQTVHQAEGMESPPEKRKVDLGEVPWAEIQTDDCFYFLVREDSMNGARIKAGDLVLIRRQHQVKDGEIALVATEKEGNILRRVYFEGDKVILQPENLGYKLMSLGSQQMKVIGKAILVQFNPNQSGL